MDRAAATAASANDTPLLDVTLLTDYAGFVVRSVIRHRVGALATFAVTLTAVAVAALAWPKTYQIDGRLLVQSNSLVSSLVNPDRIPNREGRGPTLAAQEIVKSRDSLLAIMKSTDLLAEWDRTRTPLFRLKDSLVALVRGAPTEDERIDAMAGLLEDRLQVGANDEGTVGFVLKWSDPTMGRQLVESAMQAFLEHRRVTESAAITDSIAILDRSADAIESDIKATLDQLPEPTDPEPRRVVRRPTPTSGPSAESTVRLARLRSALDDRQREVARLDGLHTQQLAEAQARLSAALTIYTESHPTVVSLKQTVARLTPDPPELAEARREARALEAQYDELSTRVGALTARAEQERLRSQLDAATDSSVVGSFRSSSETDPVGLRLKNQMAELALVQARGSAARAELASAQAGFKYQYSVVRPPQLPRAPVAPNVLAILGAGTIASLLLALAFAIGVRSRRRPRARSLAGRARGAGANCAAGADAVSRAAEFAASVPGAGLSSAVASGATAGVAVATAFAAVVSNGSVVASVAPLLRGGARVGRRGGAATRDARRGHVPWTGRRPAR